MTRQAWSHHAVAGVQKAHRRPSGSVVRFVTDRFLLLPLGAALALVWANVAAESYFRFTTALAFPVNEIGMALFLGLMAQAALEAIMPGGALHTWRRWGLPVVGAFGGIAGAAFTYLGYIYLSHEQVLKSAWPVACAIDVAAGYYLLKAIFHRSEAVPFLLVLALATDALGVLVLAAWTPFSERHLAGAILLVLAVGLAVALRRARARSAWPYLLVAGPVSWLAFYVADVHAALALVPVVPFLPRQPRRLDTLVDPPGDEGVRHIEHQWSDAVQVVLFLFGLVNAGVVIRAYDTGTWAVVAAALVGRPLGILVAVGFAVAAGLHLPRLVGWRELVVVALATSSGFTLALFFASSLLPVGAVLQQVTVGALSTVAGVVVAVAAARMLRVGRFSHRAPDGA